MAKTLNNTDTAVPEPFDERSFSPRRTLFIVLPVANADGTMDLDSATPEGYGTLDEAVAEASEDVDENGGENIVYQCVPVRRVYRKTVIVDDLTITAANAA
jgi:hypothetical protein